MFRKRDNDKSEYERRTARKKEERVKERYGFCNKGDEGITINN